MNDSLRLVLRRLMAALVCTSATSVSSAATPAQPRSIFENLAPEVRARHEATAVRLWPDRAPRAKDDTPDDIPLLYPLPKPERAASTPMAAVIVFPGGGYQYLSAQEAFPAAERFRAAGLAAFVLKYRLLPYDKSAALLDAQRAVRVLRARSAEFGVDPTRIAAIGYSAGGHLVANLSTHADDGRQGAADPVERESSRLQSALLIYPWLVFESVRARNGSHLPLPAVLKLDGLHRAVDVRTPPTFLLVGYDDDRTPYEHTLAYAARLHESGVRFELHVLGTGGHGFGTRSPDPRVQIWTPLALHWLTTCKFLPEASASVAAR